MKTVGYLNMSNM